MRNSAWLLLAAGCGTKAPGRLPNDTALLFGPDGTTPPVQTTDSATVEDSAPPTEDSAPQTPGTVTSEDAGGDGDPAAWLFSSDQVVPIDITLSDDAAASLTASPYTSVSASVVINGEELDNIGLRLKGKYGSFRTLLAKAAFKIDFNAFVPGQSFYGLTKINLNNNVVDYSYLKEHVAYKLFRDAGLPAERMGYAWVTVNGEPYGLYNILEQLDQNFLDRNYADPDGNMYDGKYLLWDDGSYTLLDLTSDVQQLYPLQVGTPDHNIDIGKVVEAIATSHGTDSYYDTVGEKVDWEQVLEYFAGEQWIGQDDGYALNTNNYYLYFDPSDGKMRFIPWDLDYTALNDADWGMNWQAPKGILASTCQADATCLAAWKTAAGVLAAHVDDDNLQASMAKWAALIEPYAEADPRRECTLDQVHANQVYTEGFYADRRSYMTNAWGL